MTDNAKKLQSLELRRKALIAELASVRSKIAKLKANTPTKKRLAAEAAQDRAMYFAKLRRNGLTYSAIAKQHQISRSRAAQLCAKGEALLNQS